MNLKKARLLSLVDDNSDVFMLKAGTRKTVNCWKAGRHDWVIHHFHVVSRFPALVITCRSRSDGLQRAVLAVRGHDAGASATQHELPCVALEIRGRCALTGRSGPGRAVVLALERNAKTFLLMRRGCSIRLSLGQGGGGSNSRERGRDRTGDDERADNVLRIDDTLHWILHFDFASRPW